MIELTCFGEQVACRQSGHGTGIWEELKFLALTVLQTAGLAQRRIFNTSRATAGCEMV